jgi:acyl-CoA thioesterase-2
MSVTDDLLEVLALEPIDVNLFRGRSPADSRKRIFGGQVIAQALWAAYQTVEERVCHSLQCYFIRPGDPSQRLLFEVETSRDGGSFTTRRVIATQRGEQIFNLACSFQAPEDGPEHQALMPATLPADEAPSELETMREFLDANPKLAARYEVEGPVEVRPVDAVNWQDLKPAPPEQRVWFRVRKKVGDAVALNQVLLAYASDLTLLATCMRPHAVTWHSGVQTASLDHALWFHRPTEMDRWHLYVQDSPSASGARGLNRGLVYRDDGVLVASVAQEGLIRNRDA